MVRHNKNGVVFHLFFLCNIIELRVPLVVDMKIYFQHQYCTLNLLQQKIQQQQQQIIDRETA